MRGKARSQVRGSRKNWKNSRALFARDREYTFALVRELHYYIPLKTRSGEMDSTKETNNSRLISTLLAPDARAPYSTGAFFAITQPRSRVPSSAKEPAENDGLGI